MPLNFNINSPTAVAITRVALQALLGASTAKNVIYRITDAVSGTRSILVQAKSSSTLNQACVSETGNSFGFYVIATDVFTPLNQNNYIPYLAASQLTNILGTFNIDPGGSGWQINNGGVVTRIDIEDGAIILSVNDGTAESSISIGPGQTIQTTMDIASGEEASIRTSSPGGIPRTEMITSDGTDQTVFRTFKDKIQIVTPFVTAGGDPTGLVPVGQNADGDIEYDTVPPGAITANDITDASDVGKAILTEANPGAIRYIRINADNTITLLTATQFLQAMSANVSGIAMLRVTDANAIVFPRFNADNSVTMLSAANMLAALGGNFFRIHGGPGVTFTGTRYAHPTKAINTASGQAGEEWPSPVNGTITEFAADITTAMPAGSALTLTIQLNQVDTSMSVTFSAGEGVRTRKVTVANPVTIAVGDFICVKGVATNTSGIVNNFEMLILTT